jgi:hypothetical protein
MYDAAGNMGSAGTKSIIIWNAPVTTAPPTVKITDPVEGQTISSVYRVKATASDDVRVQEVKFYSDGNTIGVFPEAYNDSVPPYDRPYDPYGGPYSMFEGYYEPKGYGPGQHTLVALAVDDNGNFVMSSPVHINVP